MTRRSGSALESRTLGPVWRNPGHAPCGAPSPSIFEGDGKRNAGDPLAQSRKQGPIFFDSIQRTPRNKVARIRECGRSNLLRSPPRKGGPRLGEIRVRGPWVPAFRGDERGEE